MAIKTLLRLSDRLRNAWRAVAAMVVIAALVPASPAGAQSLSQGKGDLRVMTRNLYLGASLIGASGARTPGELAVAVTGIIANVRATNPPERMAAIAREIADAQPHLVSLEEVTTWRTGFAPTNLRVEFDNLQLLLSELAAQGQSYTLLVQVPQFDFTAPSSTGEFVRLTFGTALLARTDLPPELFQVSNPHGNRYQAFFPIPVPSVGITIPNYSSWVSVDVTFHGQQFRFIGTHLEPFVPPITIAQSAELLQGPASTSLPVIVAGDFNSDANNPGDPSFSVYQNVLGAGFFDAWATVNHFDFGSTCCQNQNVANAVSLLNRRIDLVMLRGPFHVQVAELFGDDPDDRTLSGLWPSDHAGLVVRLQLRHKPSEGPTRDPRD
ncbi:MAG: endonuclease/exonuclease/phosphatase family protein [Acidobacteria bacterium]|nr:endonuclease/exonuclease/phosphatase family protein [Acidobacteriota bacterium]